jgi:hypothetical protein
MLWYLWANVVLPFGVVLLLIMVLPLHTKILRPVVNALVEFLLKIQFFNLRALGEPVSIFHAVVLFNGLFALFSWYSFYTHEEDEGWGAESFHKKASRWRKERNMYISAFTCVVYLMIFHYNKLRVKYDNLKLKVEKAESKKAD